MNDTMNRTALLFRSIDGCHHESYLRIYCVEKLGEMQYDRNYLSKYLLFKPTQSTTPTTIPENILRL